MDLNEVKISGSQVKEKGDVFNNYHMELQNGSIKSKNNGKGINTTYIQGSTVIVGEKGSFSSVESRLSPRVKQGIELKILKPGINSHVKSKTPNVSRTRTSLKSPLVSPSAPVTEQDSDSSSSTLESLKSGNTTSDSGKNVTQKKARMFYLLYRY